MANVNDPAEAVLVFKLQINRITQELRAGRRHTSCNTLVAPSETVIEIGHLEGWGASLYGGSSIFGPWTRGNGHERFATFAVRGSGKVKLKLQSCRVGERVVEVGV